MANGMAFGPITTLKLSIQRALLGEVSERLASLTCGSKGQQILIRAYFSPMVTETDREQISRVAAEVIADFPEGFTIEEVCAVLGDGEPQMLDFWAFARKPSDTG